MRAKTGTNANKRATRSHGSSRARACCPTNEKDRHHAGRAAGRRGQGDRRARNARMSRQGRGGRAWRECRSPRTQGVPKPCPLRPAALPASPSLLPFQIPRPGAAAPMAAPSAGQQKGPRISQSPGGIELTLSIKYYLSNSPSLHR